MDIALCQEILRQAEKSGAEKAFILSRSCILRSESLVGHQILSSVDASRCSKLFVQIGTGSCSALIENGNVPVASRDALLECASKCCQAARLAKVWGQNRNLAELEFRRFESEKYLAEIVDPECPLSTEKNACSDDCFRPECILNAEFALSEKLKMLDEKMAGYQAVLNAEFCVQSVEETLFIDKDIQTQRHFESSIKQSVVYKKHSLELPEYRFVGKNFDIAKLPELIAAHDIAEAFEKSCESESQFAGTGTGVLVSGWGMSVIGHETAHLHVDISPGGRVVMNLSDCLNQPVQTGECRSNGVRISLEGGLQKAILLTRIPEHTLVVDAPDAWIRRNDATLDVRFRIAYTVQNGALEQAFKPIVLRFDLKRIWYYCRFASKPYVRTALKCGNGIADFQAPWAYFEMKPEFAHL